MEVLRSGGPSIWRSEWQDIKITGECKIPCCIQFICLLVMDESAVSPGITPSVEHRRSTNSRLNYSSEESRCLLDGRVWPRCWWLLYNYTYFFWHVNAGVDVDVTCWAVCYPPHSIWSTFRSHLDTSICLQAVTFAKAFECSLLRVSQSAEEFNTLLTYLSYDDDSETLHWRWMLLKFKWSSEALMINNWWDLPTGPLLFGSSSSTDVCA